MPVPLYWRVACRAYHCVIYLISHVIRWRTPVVIKGAGSLSSLPKFVHSVKLQRGLLVTDAAIMKLGLADDLISEMKKHGAELAIYGDVLPNPTLSMVEDANELYKKNKCGYIIAVGGGSVMDCAKLVGVRQARPRTPLGSMRGILRVLWPLPPIIAVPTTAGTGSECTIAAVVVDPAHNDKFAVMDPFLTPRYCVLDPQLTVGLPKFITATTGMDTLTHAVESYINVFHYPKTDQAAIRAVELVAKYLLRAYEKGDDIEARENMLEGAFLGGVAFTRACVGNVHAAAHAVGGLYNVPHGFANAVILPRVLDMYGSTIYKPLARLADAAAIRGVTEEDKAKNFIAWIRELNVRMQIPPTLGANDERYRILDKDIPFLVRHALREANPFYPVPVIFGEAEMTAVFNSVR
ncbi:putative alcohol dehydrogenase [Leptomonas pyrrhocoris]|uniref:Alcohol dehydrogenase 4 n=1 Tax=Leptomonas pyrrhocoris TaxID=157538 RepID=A0A0N0DXR3_LEPPY|nr:putative alcohol dehydrogenase [Leptomonas pyrrhocoris]KPA83251.1 putative alcohol dehydrogenase [Leptomonas pyrrhocoris]|eukprot:XP_015661690.1 putative alcohol dehydrogenase [Leptomonas pyrrhocoris]